MLRQVVLRDAAAGEWLDFTRPREVLIATKPADVLPVLLDAEKHVARENLHAVGFLSYESASGFDRALVTRPPGRLPLVCLGLFPEPVRSRALPIAGENKTSRNRLGNWHFSSSRAEYLAKIGAIRREIASGNTYQVNYTVRQHADNAGDSWSFFLAAAADAPYAAWIDCDDCAIVSASPELFFQLNGERILCKPMKGTAPRGMTLPEDRENYHKLAASRKDRAENVMITDMIRNDIGRIALPGTVRADPLFDIEKYRTVWQMTSTVVGRTQGSVTEVFQALFPSASVTGAPKVASMRFIAEMEASARGIYTGAIGYISPERKAVFNVAIRTALLDKESGKAVYGVGGGIVWDSDPEDEYAECINKARVLATPAPDPGFELLETLLWTAEDGFFLLREHLDRLAASAEYFDFRLDRTRVLHCLSAAVRNLPSGRFRLRLLLQRDGQARTEVQPLQSEVRNRNVRLALATEAINPLDPFLYHKTTQRDVYEQMLSAAGDCDDVLLWNPNNEITESTIANVVVRLGGELFTPPVSCGLLAGTFREKLVREDKVRERTIEVAELAGAEALYLVNSVRGWMSVEFNAAKQSLRT